MIDGDGALASYRIGPFVLFPEKRQLHQSGSAVNLSAKTVDLLAAMVREAGRMLSKEELFAAVWPGLRVDENNLSVHVSALRKVLGRDAITTNRGQGYRLNATVEAVAAPVPTPPLKNSLTNLPRRPTLMIGRDAELGEGLDTIRRSRLVTLTGPSGVGKTWLAVELGWRAAVEFPDGVWLSDLSPLRDPDGVAAAIATMLGLSLRGGRAPADEIAAAIAGKRMLLIIDNCEHLASAAASFIEALLPRSTVTVLATSQESLRVPGEEIIRLRPLAVPPAGAPDVLARRYDAVELFVARATAADRRFQLSIDNAEIVAQICRRLDGVPLAIEMAASRIPILGLDALLTGLDERLQLLSHGARHTADRQRSLRAAVEWSYGLLDEEERLAFRQVSIFAGSFSLDAANAVSGRDVRLKWQTADLLGRLIDKSIITTEGGGEPRYRVLETLRLFGKEQIESPAERDQLAERHASYYVKLFEMAEVHWEMTPDAIWRDRHAIDLDNARAALRWCIIAPGQSERAIALMGTAGRLWERLELLSQGRTLVEALLNRVTANTPPKMAARLYRVAGGLWLTADRKKSLELQLKAAELYRQQRLWEDVGAVMARVGSAYIFLNRLDEAEYSLTQAQEFLKKSGYVKSLCLTMNELGSLALLTGSPLLALNRYSNALDLAKILKDQRRRDLILINLAEIDFSVGRTDRAIVRVREAMNGLRASNQRAALGWASVNLATYLLAENDPVSARPAAIEALSLVRDDGGYWLRLSLQQWALIGAIEGRSDAAARLLGFVDSGIARSGEQRQPGEKRIHDKLLALLASSLTPDEIKNYTADGAGWDDAAAVDFAHRAVVDFGTIP
jgi:predicted ATPase/DNA-binding winged helix-turn-helix (wHTH) protein